MGRIIHLFGDRHQDTLRLLPWYVTGQLEPGECDAVEAHLADCADCREEVQAERRLRSAIAVLPVDFESLCIDNGAADGRSAERPSAPRVVQIRHRRFGPATFGWFLAGQCAVALLIIVMIAPPRQETLYQGLESAAVKAPGSMIVMFRPDATEQAISEALTASGARIVDGPTSVGAYLVSAPAAKRSSVLQYLRETRIVVLVEPMVPETSR